MRLYVGVALSIQNNLITFAIGITLRPARSTPDAEMTEEEEEEMKVSGIREKMKEFDFMAYFYQTFNRTEALRWRSPKYSEQFNHFCYWHYVETCPKYSRR
ncbi:hypothetical protein AABB24_025494 [Solanum stoloniferum]|uniref:Uncharacterized protein n=1 Tax=Solanum stoloniferum TaxID=62892 RepID=A0ABD2SA34_9SOLN